MSKRSLFLVNAVKRFFSTNMAMHIDNFYSFPECLLQPFDGCEEVVFNEPADEVLMMMRKILYFHGQLFKYSRELT